MSAYKFLDETLLDDVDADEVVDDDASVGLDGARAVYLRFSKYRQVAKGNSAALEKFLGRCGFVERFTVDDDCESIGMLTSGMELADLCRVVCYALFVLAAKTIRSDNKFINLVDLFTIWD